MFPHHLLSRLPPLALLPCRSRLARLLEAERHEYEREIEASFEPPEVVKERLFAKARELKARNEAERRRQAEELEMRRFRQGSDLLRARDSAILAQRMADDRVAQLRDKVTRTREEKAADRAQELAILARSQEEEAKAAERLRSRKAAEARLRVELDAQVAVKQELHRRAVGHAAAADEDALERWRREAEEAEAAAAERKRAAREELARTREANARAEEVLRRQAAEEADRDRSRIASIVEREQRQAEAERAAAEARRAEARAHRGALERQMAVEAEAGDKFDQFFAAYQEKEWAKREAVWAAQAEAKRLLDEEVARTRERQRAELADRRAAEAAEDERMRQATAERDRRLAIDDDNRRRAIRERAEQQRRDNAAQIARREAMRAREAQLEYLEGKLQEREEERYQRRVEKLLAEPPKDDGHRRRKPMVE